MQMRHITSVSLLAACIAGCGGSAPEDVTSSPEDPPPHAQETATEVTASSPWTFHSSVEEESAPCWMSAPTSGCNGWFGIRGIAPTTMRSRSGAQSLRLAFDRNEGVGMATRVVNARHLFVRFHDFYDQGFDFAAGMKILRLSSFDSVRQRNNFDIILQSRASAPTNNYCGTTDSRYLSIAFNGGPVDWGILDAPMVYQRGRWYQTDVEIQLNAPGQSDGAVRVWIDGRLQIEKTRMNIVGTVTAPINRVSIGGWYSNSAAGKNPCPDPSALSVRYIDDIVISDGQIR